MKREYSKNIFYLLLATAVVFGLSGCEKKQIENTEKVVEEVIIDPCEESGVKPITEADHKYFEVSSFNIKEYDLFEEKEMKESLKELVENPYNAVMKLNGDFEEGMVGEAKLQFINDHQFELKVRPGVEENKRTGFGLSGEEKSIKIDLESEEFKSFLDASNKEEWKKNRFTSEILELYGGLPEIKEAVVEEEKELTNTSEEEKKEEKETDGATKTVDEDVKTSEEAKEKVELEKIDTDENQKELSESEAIAEEIVEEQFVREFTESIYGYLLLVKELQAEDSEVDTHLNCRKVVYLDSYLKKFKEITENEDESLSKEKAVRLVVKPFLTETKLDYLQGKVTATKGVYAVKHLHYMNKEPQTDRNYVGIILY